MVVNVHAGHNPAGMAACGAVGILNESVENRIIKDLVIRKLRELGHTVYDCTVNDGTSQNDVLRKIVAKCNEHKADLDISIHLNSGLNDYVGDGSVGGTEAFIYNLTAGALIYAQGVVRSIAELGFPIRDDRIKDDVKENSALYVLSHTKAPAMLIECCFVDDKDDAARYNAEAMANAIVKGITGTLPASGTEATQQVTYVVDQRKSDEEVAKEVIKGIWGTGNERKARLTNAGYNAQAIQNIVNAMCNGTYGRTVVSQPSVSYSYYPKATSGRTLTEALNSIGVNSSYANRKVIAAKNNIAGYAGTYEQNIQMWNLLKEGKLISV